MGTSPVTDIKSFFPGTVGAEPAGKPVQTNEMFAKAMSDATVRTAPGTVGMSDPEAVRQAPGAGQRIRKADNADARRLDNSGNSAAQSTSRSDAAGGSKDEISGKIKEKADEIAGAIKEELGISDEEFEEAMAQMGLVPTDLLDVGSIKDLMLELTGEQDPLALITNEELMASINSISDLVREMIDELSAEFGITPEEVIGMAQDMELPEEIAAAVSDISEADEESDREDTIRVEINRTDSEPKQDVTQEGASIERKSTEVLKDRKQDDGMQGAMSGQNYAADFEPTAGEAVQTAAEVPSSYANTEEILKQVTDYMKVNIGTDASSLELQLHPASLGTVNLQIASSNGVITANLLVQNETVKAALESQMVQLLETFEEQGQKVEAIEVSVAGYDLDRSLNQNNDSGTDSRQERSDDTVGRVTRRRINLNELDEDDIEELSEEEQLAAEMMTLNGGSVDYLA